MKDLLLKLIAHMRWADAIVAGALITEPKQRGAAPDPDAVRFFAHIAAAGHVWYARMQGTTPEVAVWPSLSPEEARDLAAENAAAYERLVSNSDDAGLRRIVSYTNSAGHAFESSVVDIVTHVTAHGTYHRGQIALRIRAAGGVPPYTDYIQYTRRDQ